MFSSGSSGADHWDVQLRIQRWPIRHRLRVLVGGPDAVLRPQETIDLYPIDPLEYAGRVASSIIDGRVVTQQCDPSAFQTEVFTGGESVEPRSHGPHDAPRSGLCASQGDPESQIRGGNRRIAAILGGVTAALTYTPAR